MDFGRIIGRVVCTIKDPKLENLPLLIVQGCDDTGEPNGPRIIAADAIGVGEGEFVWYETSREAPMAWEQQPPVDAAIVGIVDKVHAIQNES
jgi:ethanolamine utilization protein EutN